MQLQKEAIGGISNEVEVLLEERIRMTSQPLKITSTVDEQ